jgi:hypothetical protein
MLRICRHRSDVTAWSLHSLLTLKQNTTSINQSINQSRIADAKNQINVPFLAAVPRVVIVASVAALFSVLVVRLLVVRHQVT